MDRLLVAEVVLKKWISAKMLLCTKYQVAEGNPMNLSPVGLKLLPASSAKSFSVIKLLIPDQPVTFLSFCQLCATGDANMVKIL
jgi:hypothetical protein